MRDCHREIAGGSNRWAFRCERMPLESAGGLPGRRTSRARWLVGSHLDTVLDAGSLRTGFSVVLAIGLLEGLGGRKLPYGIEVVGFSEEEGVRFGTPSSGAGRSSGVWMRPVGANGFAGRFRAGAIEDFGLNPAEIFQAALEDDVLGYLEFHIEQGPVLEQRGLPLGVVDAIAGQSRLEFTFLGSANHAGTTPMDLRYRRDCGRSRMDQCG